MSKSPLMRADEEEKVAVVKPEPLRILLTWQAPTRPFKKREREYFTTIGAIVFLVGVILVFLREWFLIGAIVALTFVSYIMASVPPEMVEHKITNKGVVSGGRTYPWAQLGRFWFTKKWNQQILHIETLLPFPRQLTFLLEEMEKEKAERILSDYLLLEKPEETWLDKASHWLSHRFSLEETS